MISIRLQVGRSIGVVLRCATNFSTIASKAASKRPLTAEEAEAWSLRTKKMRARLKAEADSSLWPYSS